MLPTELIQALNDVYFLHVLATDPEKVIPPGKSLLSLMGRYHYPEQSTPDPSTILHDRVEEAVHRAFWNEASESLSSLNPSTQLPRLKALYTDLLDALSPLFPKQHPALKSLSLPLPPTSSPLHSALTLLKEILTALRQRCASVRDPDIDALLAKIDEPPLHGTQLAALVIDIFRSLITLADTLKSDLAQSTLGTMSESQLATVIAQRAHTRERELVLDMWGGSGNVRAVWEKWVSSEPEGAEERRRKRWVARLMKALALPIPVSCDVPPPLSSAHQQTATQSASTERMSRNELPPQFFFTAPALFYLQNYLQALVVAASLRSLTRIPLPPAAPNLGTGNPPGSDFMSRVWTLLKAEIDRDDDFAIGVGATGRSREEQEDPTKIINLADEVIRVRRLSSGMVTEQEEKALRVAVERTLRTTDPVFLLLLERVVHAVVGWLDDAVSEDVTVHHGVPERMRTGREIKGCQCSHVYHTIGREYKKSPETPKLGSVKGFEDPVLAKGIQDLIIKAIRCVQWTEEVWGDLI